MNDISFLIKGWRENPVKFVMDNFGVKPDKWQEKALLAFASNDLAKLHICLSACAGPGKSAVLCWMGWNFLSCYGDSEDHPKGAAVSITSDNLADNLWAEFSKWQNKSKYLMAFFEWTKTRIFAKEHPETWFLSARSFPRGADNDTIGKTLSGLHSKYVLFLIDESGDIPPMIAKTAEQAIGETLGRPGGFAKIVQAGNPISVTGLLYTSVRDPAWYTIRITGDPEDPDRSPRINIDWAREQIAKHGRDDPWVMAYICGEFPKAAINQLLTIDEVEAAMDRHYSIKDYGYSQKRLGVDVAREGLDSTILFPRQGLAAFMYVKMPKVDGHVIATRIMMARDKWGQELDIIDNTGGFGSSVVDALINLHGQSPLPIHFSENALSNKFYNRRAEMFYTMAEWIKRGGALPKCETLKKELITPTYSFKKGKLIIESKDQIKKRLGFSPDRADALCLTFAVPDTRAKGEFDHLDRSKGKMITEYNPLDRL